MGGSRRLLCDKSDGRIAAVPSFHTSLYTMNHFGNLFQGLCTQKCQEENVLHSCVKMCTVLQEWNFCSAGPGLRNYCSQKMKGSFLLLYCSVVLILIIQPWCFSLLDPRCYPDGFFQRWLFSKLNCNLGAIGCCH